MKKKQSYYGFGKRSDAWVKYKTDKSQELVIGGCTTGTPFDGLVVGYYENGKLIYVSKVRNGFVPHVRREVFKYLLIVEKLFDFEDAQVFEDAGTYTTLLFLSRSTRNSPEYAKLGSIFRSSGPIGLASALAFSTLSFASLVLTEDGSRWTLSAGAEGKVLTRLAIEGHCARRRMGWTKASALSGIFSSP